MAELRHEVVGGQPRRRRLEQTVGVHDQDISRRQGERHRRRFVEITQCTGDGPGAFDDRDPPTRDVNGPRVPGVRELHRHPRVLVQPEGAMNG